MRAFALLAVLSTFTLFYVSGSTEIRAEYAVPSVRLADLDQDQDKLRHVLSEFGMVAVTNVPDLGQLRKAVFSSLLDCSQANSEAFEFTSALDPLTQRKAIASETLRHVPRPLSANVAKQCPSLASSAPSFRNVISEVSNAFTAALDRQFVLHAARFKRTPYTSFAAIQAEGSQLEHFVTYTSSPTSSPSSRPPLELHVDEGLFIAFVPPMLSNDDRGHSGLVVRLPSGQLAIAKYSCSDCVVFMLGAGFSRWLGSNLPGVIHALRMPTRATRAWYGRMFLPPADAVAVLPSGTVIDFANYRLQHNSSTFLEEHALTCMERSVVEGVVTRKLANDCPPDQFHCWMKCYQSQELLSCGATEMRICASNSDGRECLPTQMGCGPRCVPDNSTSKSGGAQSNQSSSALGPDQFCDARSAVTMYMEGFIWPNSGQQSCVRMLFPSWILDTKGKYAGGCVGTFLFGVFVEFLAFLRAPRTKEACQTTTDGRCCTASSLYSASILILGMQAACGYFLMFLAMTFSIPIFMCAVFGLMVGHAVFNLRAHHKHAAERPHC